MRRRSSCVQLFATLWTVTCQASLSVGFSRQEYWNGLPCHPPGIFLTKGFKPCLYISCIWQVGSLPLCHLRSEIKKMCACAKSLQSCSTLCNPMDCNLPGFSIHGILQARILEWVSMSSSGIFPTQGANLYLCVVATSSGKQTHSEGQCRDIRDAGSIPGLGRSPAGRHGNPLQYSCLENPMDRGAWQATVHGAAKSQTRLSTSLTEMFVSAGVRALLVQTLLVW